MPVPYQLFGEREYLQRAEAFQAYRAGAEQVYQQALTLLAVVEQR